MDRNWDNLLVVKAKEFVHHSSYPLDLELDSCLRLIIPLDVLCPLDEFAIQQLCVYNSAKASSVSASAVSFLILSTMSFGSFLIVETILEIQL